MEYKTTEKINKKVIEEILEIKDKEGLTPENIVKNAKRKTSPLHELFEWDNVNAGEKWRLQQARVLLNEVKIIVEDKEYYAFENVNIIVNNPNSSETTEVVKERQYVGRIEILSNEDFRKQVLQKALNQLTYWGKQYESYKEFESVLVEIQKVENKFKKGGIVNAD